MQIQGEIKRIGETVQVTANFSKREIILITDRDTSYPQTISMQLSNDRTDLIDPYKVGQIVTVDFQIQGREWTDGQGKINVFNTLSAWKIQPV